MIKKGVWYVFSQENSLLKLVPDKEPVVSEPSASPNGGEIFQHWKNGYPLEN